MRPETSSPTNKTLSGNKSAWITPRGRSRGKAGAHFIGARFRLAKKDRPGFKAHCIGPGARKRCACAMQFAESFARLRATARARALVPNSIEKGHDRRGPPGKLSKRIAAPVAHRLRAVQTLCRKMLHQRQKK